MLDFFYIHLINPIFYYYDIFYEYYYNKKIEKIENEFCNYYDIENNKIIINYHNDNNDEYKLIINRNNENNLKEEIGKLKKLINQEDLLVNVTFNNIDITKRVLSIIGPNGKHNLLYKIKVEDILNNYEKNNFDSFEIMDDMCDIKNLKLEDYIL